MDNIAMIPARIGSERLKVKNLALINGKPMIYYAIQAAISSGVFDRIIINSDHEIFKEIATRYGVEFYLRPKELGQSQTKMDDVIYDFIKNHDCDIVTIVNTPSPLQTGEQVKAIVEFFKQNNVDSLITTCGYQVHSYYNGQPLNFDKNTQFAKTQDLKPIETLIYSTMIWKADVFSKEYEQKGYAFFGGNFVTYPVSKENSLLVKTEEDLKLIDRIMRSKEQNVEYDPLLNLLDK